VDILVEQFSLTVGLSESDAACRRALRRPGWQEQPPGATSPRAHGDESSFAAFRRAIGFGLAAAVSAHDPPEIQALATRMLALPDPSPGASATIEAKLGAIAGLRISLRERWAATEVTLAAAVPSAQSVGRVRMELRELRRSIEIQSGSTRPSRPAG
jgi:hypothetical protein